MSVFDQQPGNTAGCLGCCVSPEHSIGRDFQNQNQNIHEGLTGEVQRKTKEFDLRLSEAFNELTFEERERQQEVLHGVDDQIAEEATFIEASLQELDAHLERKKRGTEYETAEQMDSVYVQEKAFRVMFLRSNDYDARAAAAQMLLFFKVKQKLFGVEKMVREITVEDLDEHDRASLNTGWLQLNGKDSAGRVIFVQLSGLRAFKELNNELRGKFYFLMQLLKKEETQIKGIVHLLYSVEEFRDQSNGVGFIENTQLSLAIPVKNAAIQYCCSDPSEWAFSSISVKIMPSKLVTRLRIHLGSHLECQYRLWSFGIPRLYPIANGINHVPPLTRGVEAPSSANIKPNANDVLSAGTKTSNNPGNQLLRNLILLRWQLYDSGVKERKRDTVNDVIEEIHHNGGRFLKQTNPGSLEPLWMESPIEEVRTKIAQLFRNQKRASIRASSGQKETMDGTSITGAPLQYDVVFGKAQNTGKDFLLQLIRERSEDYDALDRGMKASIVNVIIDKVKEKGGRFLVPTQEAGVFLEVSDDKARERISKSFRNYRRTKK